MKSIELIDSPTNDKVPKERFINFIVDDLIKKTVIDHDMGTIKLPFLLFYLRSPIPTSTFSLFSFPTLSLSSLSLFSTYLLERYGWEKEIGIIWDGYIERIKSLVDNG